MISRGTRRAEIHSCSNAKRNLPSAKAFMMNSRCTSQNQHDSSCDAENDADSEEENLDSLFPAACPNACDEGRTGLRSGKNFRPFVRQKTKFVIPIARRNPPKRKCSGKGQGHIKHKCHPDREGKQHCDDPTHKNRIYRCSKSTGAVTSCTRKYFASAGYFRATASYIAYATLR